MTDALTIVYPFTAENIEAARARYAELSADTSKGYEQVRKAIRTCRGMRGQIEERRKDLKRDSLEFGRKVDAVAKELTALVSSIEEPLKLKKAAVDDEKERIKRERQEAERQRVAAELEAKREAEEARLRAEREAEEARLAAEREALAAERRKAQEAARAERERLAAEQARLDAERQKAAEEARQAQERQEAEARAERERIAEERRALEVERQRIADEKAAAERAEAERKAKIRAEQEAKARAEREAREAEERKREQERREAEHRARLEALRPDAEKLALFAGALRKLKGPEVQTEEAREAVNAAMRGIRDAADGLSVFLQAAFPGDAAEGPSDG